LVVNRFHYLGDGDTGPVSASYAMLAGTGFIAPTPPSILFETDTLANAMQDSVSVDLSFLSAYVRNLYDPTDFVEMAYPGTILGSRSGDSMSPTAAYGIRSSRVRTDIRRGSKRFAGVIEGALQGGGVLNSTGLAIVAYLAEKTAAQIVYTVGGASYTLTPATLKFQEYTTPRGNKAYKKQDNAAAQVANSATGASWAGVSTVRTQTSRQYEHGA
jgi:hypothetical protein